MSQLGMLYFFTYKLAEAWQVGFDPTTSDDAQASGGNMNIKVGGEYSVVSQDLFGQRFQLRFQITPVIPSLIANPILRK